MFTRTLAIALAASLVLSASAALASQAVTLNKVGLLSSPFAGSKLLSQVEQGSKVSVLWCAADVGFCLVQYHAHQGFVAVSEINVIDPTGPATTPGGSNGGKAALVGPHVVIGGGIGFPKSDPGALEYH